MFLMNFKKSLYGLPLGVKVYTYIMIEQKGMTFDHDCGYSFPFLLPPKKRGKKKRRINDKNHDRKA